MKTLQFIGGEFRRHHPENIARQRLVVARVGGRREQVGRHDHAGLHALQRAPDQRELRALHVRDCRGLAPHAHGADVYLRIADSLADVCEHALGGVARMHAEVDRERGRRRQHVFLHAALHHGGRDACAQDRGRGRRRIHGLEHCGFQQPEVRNRQTLAEAHVRHQLLQELARHTIDPSLERRAGELLQRLRQPPDGGLCDRQRQ